VWKVAGRLDLQQSKVGRWLWQAGAGRDVGHHHGHHGSEATRGILVKEEKDHAILKGLEDGAIFGPTDVYTVKLPLPAIANHWYWVRWWPG